ncbi:flavoprotein-like protein [Lipomyces starkeyi]
MAPKVAICLLCFYVIIYSMYGHIAQMAEAEKAGGSATIYQIPETLSEEVLQKMYAAPKPDYPIATANILLDYDAFLFGVPTRYGNFPAQWKAFWDTTGGLWAKAALAGKYVGQFVSTGTPGGGQEATVMNALSTYAFHGMIFPSVLEKEIATIQGETFYKIVFKAFH